MHITYEIFIFSGGIMKIKLYYMTITLFLLIIYSTPVFANIITLDSDEQSKWYDAQWYKWYNALPSEIQTNVDLPNFSDWEVQTQYWFNWYNGLPLENQSKIKKLDYDEWNAQTSKWLKWFSMLPIESQNKINLRDERNLYDRYNSLSMELQKIGPNYFSGDLFMSIQLDVYGAPLRDFELIRGVPYDLIWYDWFHLLPLGEQKSVYCRPKNFALIQRGVYGINTPTEEEYITVDKAIPPTRFRIDGQPLVSYSAVDLLQRYEPTTLNKVYEISQYRGEDFISYSHDPFLITFDLSDSNILAEDSNYLYGVLYNGDKIEEYLNGTYNEDTKTFVFYANNSGNYAVIIAKNIIRINLTIGDTSYIINGALKALDSAPVIVDGRTLVPIRVIADCFGVQVNWDEATKTDTIIYNGKTLVLTVGQLSPDLDVPAQIINDTIMVPVRYISEKFGASVVYDDESKSITITEIVG